MDSTVYCYKCNEKYSHNKCTLFFKCCDAYVCYKCQLTSNDGIVECCCGMNKSYTCLPPLFDDNELELYHQRLRNGEILSTDNIGGCHTYIRNLDNQCLETLVTFDNVHFIMGIDEHHGCKSIQETTAKDIVEWYNMVHKCDAIYADFKNIPGNRAVYIKS